jgi:hypothetical protein
VVVKDTVTISVEGTTHRSIELRVQSTVNDSSLKIRLFRTLNSADTLAAEYPILVKDTTIIDDNNGEGLQLNTEYTYYAVTIDTAGEIKDTGSAVTARTLAPTSHNYTWQEYTIGDFGSALYDVWGTDENNVYAVGGVTLNGNSYSILHYDGTEWSPIDSAGGNVIFGFSNNDIWVAGGGVFHFDGVKWNPKDKKIVNGAVITLDSILKANTPYTSIWGTSSSDMYFGNAWGKVIHWDGASAEIVCSGYNSQFKAIDGYNSNFIIAVGTGLTPPSSSAYFDGNDWSDFQYVDNYYSLNSVSIVIPNDIYWGGEGIFETKNGSFTKIVSTGYYVWDVEYNRATGEIAATGALDGLHIYNGLEWTSFKGIISNDLSTYSGIYFTGSKIFCAGRNNSFAKMIIGTK